MSWLEDVLWEVEAHASGWRPVTWERLSCFGCLGLVALVVGGIWYLTSKGIMTW